MAVPQLFQVSTEDVALTTDEWYTPHWLFTAADITFDLDVAAPLDPASRTCPARCYLTVVEDGLAQDWDGIVWMNPPYSNPGPWVSRWATHGQGLALLPAARNAAWRGLLAQSSDAIALIDAEFMRPEPGRRTVPYALILAARGHICTEALARVAMADRCASGAYHVKADGQIR